LSCFVEGKQSAFMSKEFGSAASGDSDHYGQAEDCTATTTCDYRKAGRS
jgi:hypothetical protein